VKVWLALDPDDAVRRHPRITMQAVPFDQEVHRALEHTLLGAPRWEVREAEIPDETWADLMAARIPPEEQTELHWALWEAAA
jgi:hypothetical protein